ncbi:MAG: hypothetical protein IJH38_01345 [Clostridia bacterium]|nr:hypothetical protein [Clostridia bacterium]
MTMSLKMLADVAAHAQAMADEAKAMAEAMKIVVDDCAVQLAAKKSGNDGSAMNEPVTKAPPSQKYTITEVRAFISERSKPENRAQIKAILNGLGVSKLTELPEGKYGQLMDEVSKL